MFGEDVFLDKIFDAKTIAKAITKRPTKKDICNICKQKSYQLPANSFLYTIFFW